MALETLPPISAIDFSFSSSSPENYSRFYDNNLLWTTNALVNDIISSSSPPPSSPPLCPSNNDSHVVGEVIFPSLPPLFNGHPEVHLRNGIMNASRLALAHEPDAEHAFFVADLGQVYRQHQRWKSCLPEIQPFYG